LAESCYFYGGLLVRSPLAIPGLGNPCDPIHGGSPNRDSIVLNFRDLVDSQTRRLLFRWLGRFGVALFQEQANWIFTSAGGTVFRVDSNGRTVDCQPRPGGWPGVAAEVFVRRILPRVIQLHGKAVLHAAALDTGAGVVLLCGLSGAGKSTLAASLHQQLGWTILADDMAILEEHAESFSVLPAAGTVSLWEDSKAAFAGSFEHAERLVSYERKFQCQPRRPVPLTRQPLRAVYHLESVQTTQHGTVNLSTPAPMEQLAMLSRQVIRFNPADRQSEAYHFERIGRLANVVPIRSLCYRRGFDKLAEVADRLLALHPSGETLAAR
jgi:hypothetical protein